MQMVAGRYTISHKRQFYVVFYTYAFCQVLYMDHHGAALLMCVETICGLLEIVTGVAGFTNYLTSLSLPLETDFLFVTGINAVCSRLISLMLTHVV